MKRIILSITVFILAMCSVNFAKSLYMTKARFYKDIVYGTSKYSNTPIANMVGVYSQLYGPTILIRTSDLTEVYDVQTGILTGINDTEDENVKLLTFIWRIEDGANYKYYEYNYNSIGVDNICAYVSFFDDRVCIDESNSIMEYHGSISNEVIEELLFPHEGGRS